MKQWIATAAALALLTGVTAANAQNPPASTNDKSDKTTQSGGMTPGKSNASQQTQKSPSQPSQKHAMTKHKMRHHTAMRRRGTTTGEGRIGGPQNDPSIHQSKQRDSRGTPKGPGSDYNK